MAKKKPAGGIAPGFDDATRDLARCLQTRSGAEVRAAAGRLLIVATEKGSAPADIAAAAIEACKEAADGDHPDAVRAVDYLVQLLTDVPPAAPYKRVDAVDS